MESPAESMALRMPICARPLAPPPLSVSPILGLMRRAVESCAPAGRIKMKIKQPVINRIWTELKNESLLIVQKVCHKITQREGRRFDKFENPEN
jgi:hypothetical protein